MFRTFIARIASWLKRHPHERADALDLLAAAQHARAERLERRGRVAAEQLRGR